MKFTSELRDVTQQQILNWMNVTWSKLKKSCIGQTPSTTERISCCKMCFWLLAVQCSAVRLLHCAVQRDWNRKRKWRHTQRRRNNQHRVTVAAWNRLAGRRLHLVTWRRRVTWPSVTWHGAERCRREAEDDEDSTEEEHAGRSAQSRQSLRFVAFVKSFRW